MGFLQSLTRFFMPFVPLKHGDSGTRVEALQLKLANQGFFKGRVLGNFLDRTQSSLVAFQQTHLGQDGRPLNPTGIYDESTDWALTGAPSGIGQRQHLDPLLPAGLNELRRRTLALAISELEHNVVEVPDGSNTGPHIADYLRYMGIGPNPWCASFVGWLIGTCEGGWLPWDKQGDKAQYASVAKVWSTCRKLGWTSPANVAPIPGDLFVMLHDDGTGHVGMVLRVDAAHHLAEIIEGNSGNRVALRTRAWGVGGHVGWVRWERSDQADDWERGLSAKGAAAAGISDR